jgi:hypothetical protein
MPAQPVYGADLYNPLDLPLMVLVAFAVHLAFASVPAPCRHHDGGLPAMQTKNSDADC